MRLALTDTADHRPRMDGDRVHVSSSDNQRVKRNSLRTNRWTTLELHDTVSEQCM